MVKKTIMVVDDEKFIRKVVKEIFTPEGFEVVTAQNSQEALKKLKKVKPDLVLIDFFMPGMSGKDLCATIRKNKVLKNLNVVFFTVARFSKEGMKELERMKVLDCIRKPFDYKNLVKRVRKIVG